MTFIAKIGALFQRGAAGKASILVRRKTVFGSASRRAFASPHMQPTRTNLTRGYPMALLSAAILATTAIFIRPLTQTDHLPPLVLALGRDSIVALTLLVAFGLLRPRLLRVKRHHLLCLLTCSLAMEAANAARNSLCD
jgi:uncharacterized membrane protein YvlD (DUF360 family)